MDILQTKNLTKYYGEEPLLVKALDGITLQIEQGSFTAVVGTSGSGKSTLLHMLGGLDTPTGGSVVVDGQSLSGMNRSELTIFRRRKVGFIFQNYNLIPNLTIYDNIVLPVELDGRCVDEQYFQNIVTVLGLEDKLQRKPNKLSGGQQQRAAIARAVINRPGMVFADEPTGALNKSSSEEVLGLLSSLHRGGQGIVMVTHDVRVALYGTRILYMEDGRIIDELVMGEYEEKDGKAASYQKEREKKITDWLSALHW